MESNTIALSLLRYFSVIPDPRQNCGKLHKLEKILAVSVLAIMGGA